MINREQVEIKLRQAPQRQFIGMSRSERQQYSISRCIRSQLEHKEVKDGIEFEMHCEVRRGLQHEPSGILVPNDVFLLTRDLNATTFGQGGATVPTHIEPEMVELLRNRTVCERMGVKRIAGLTGNVGIPRHSASITPYALPEQQTLVKATSTLDQILVTPHRVGAWQNYTKQLALTSGIDIEMFLREDLLSAMNVKTDSLILNGQGANSEPTGVLNTAGIGSLVFGGTATWAEVLNFESILAAANADCRPNGRYGFITSPAVKNRWKALLKAGVGVSSTLANSTNFIWETTGDTTGDGVVNGYRAAATNQVLNNLVFAGNWADTVLAMFGTGVELVVDEFTLAADATVRVVMNQFIDLAIRHAASYVVSADSGAN